MNQNLERIAYQFTKQFKNETWRTELCFNDLTQGVSALFYTKDPEELIPAVLDYMKQYAEVMSV